MNYIYIGFDRPTTNAVVQAVSAFQRVLNDRLVAYALPNGREVASVLSLQPDCNFAINARVEKCIFFAHFEPGGGFDLVSQIVRAHALQLKVTVVEWDTDHETPRQFDEVLRSYAGVAREKFFNLDQMIARLVERLPTPPAIETQQ